MLPNDFKIYKEVIKYISRINKEPNWMYNLRLKSLILYKEKKYKNVIKNINSLKVKNYIKKLDFFIKNSINFAYNVTNINNNNINVNEKKIKFNSSNVFNNFKNDLEQEGIIVINSIKKLEKYPIFLKRFFNENLFKNKNPFYLLNFALFRFFLFIYIPKGIKILKPIQNILIKNKENFNQFNKTFIILDEKSELTYIEGCTSQNNIFNDSISLPVIEVILMKNSILKYITFNNYTNNSIHFINKNFFLKKNSNLIYLDFSINSKININYINFILKGNNSNLKSVLIETANKNEFKYKELYIRHIGSKTFSNIISKFILVNNGINYGNKILKILNKNYKNTTRFNSLLINNNNYYSSMSLEHSKKFVKNEISSIKISNKQIVDLTKKGLSRKESINYIINEFINDIINEFPIEFSIEFISLINNKI